MVGDFASQILDGETEELFKGNTRRTAIMSSRSCAFAARGWSFKRFDCIFARDTRACK